MRNSLKSRKNAVISTLKCVGILACILIIGLYLSPVSSELRDIPNEIYVYDEDISISDIKLNIEKKLNDKSFISAFATNSPLSVDYEYNGEDALIVSADSNTKSIENEIGRDGRVDVKLFGKIPVKSVNVLFREKNYVVPGGSCVGISIRNKGLLVIATGDVVDENGNKHSPANECGIKQGDIIEKINGNEITSSADIARVCKEAGGNAVKLTVFRKGNYIDLTCVPYKDWRDGNYKLGTWVRDTTSGVGTLSFYSKEYNAYGALGHAITDADTQVDIRVADGDLYSAEVVGIIKGEKGKPGEIRGSFGKEETIIGDIDSNNEFGVFGNMINGYYNTSTDNNIEIAYPEEIRTGDAKIVTTIDDIVTEEYNCNVIKLYPQSVPSIKSMVIEITDEKLLNSTGGIIQGMSGSPVIQNGKLVGVVTHVFINDPTKGYCVYASWMMEKIKESYSISY